MPHGRHWLLRRFHILPEHNPKTTFNIGSIKITKYIKLTFKNPVRLSKLILMFFMRPNSENLSFKSSSEASSCTEVTNKIHPSTAVS